MAIMTLSEYAAHRGVSRPAISRAVKNGVCPAMLDEMGRKMIDSDVADAQWPATKAGNSAGVNGREKTNTDSENRPAPTASTGGSTIIQSRTVKEAYAARMAKLDYEERIGKTIEADKVKEDSFKAARIVRDNMLNIPDRMAAELAGETNQFTIHKKLTDEIKKAIQDAINTIRNQELPSE